MIQSRKCLLSPLSRVFLFLVVFAGCLGFSAMAVQAALPTITGTVSLPSGTAPAGGVDIKVFAYNFGVAVSEKEYTIPQNQSSITYSLDVVAGRSYEINYSYTGNSYLTNGYYTSSGTTVYSDEAESVEVDSNNINLTLLDGYLIQGTVSLPNGNTAPDGGMDIVVGAADSNRGFTIFSTKRSLLEGSSSVSYTIRVPEDTGASWVVYYLIDTGDDDGAYVKLGLYATTGTTAALGAATMLPGIKDDYTSIDMTILKARFPWHMFLPAIQANASK